MATTGRRSGDRLIWVAAAAVVGMAAIWILIESPWSAATDDEQATLATRLPARVATSDATLATGSSAAVAVRGSGADAATDPLVLARLALAAGMLIEPVEYSAWTLFGQAAAADPTAAAAREGLEQVATALLARGDTAFEQGRYADAEAIASTIIASLPAHAGAASLLERVVRATTETPRASAAAADSTTADTMSASAAASGAAASAADEPGAVDPIPALHDAFRSAMASNAVLTPIGASARDLVGEMISLDPDHELTAAARDLLVTEMLDRSTQAVEALDAAAARTWIESARPLATDAAMLERADERLRQFLVRVESQRLVPLSELVQLGRAAPEYPAIALQRGVEGWVEVGFVVSAAGETEEITVLDATNAAYFGDAAIAAVSAWTFEPVVFMGQAIPRRTHTRLAFVLD